MSSLSERCEVFAELLLVVVALSSSSEACRCLYYIDSHLLIRLPCTLSAYLILHWSVELGLMIRIYALWGQQRRGIALPQAMLERLTCMISGDFLVHRVVS